MKKRTMRKIALITLLSIGIMACDSPYNKTLYNQWRTRGIAHTEEAFVTDRLILGTKWGQLDDNKIVEYQSMTQAIEHNTQLKEAIKGRHVLLNTRDQTKNINGELLWIVRMVQEHSPVSTRVLYFPGATFDDKGNTTHLGDVYIENPQFSLTGTYEMGTGLKFKRLP